MATIIDALLVSLGFDDSQFKRGQQEAEKSLDDMRRDVDRTEQSISQSQGRTQGSLAGTGKQALGTADQIEAGSRRSGMAFHSLNISANTAAKGVTAAGEAMLSPFAALAAAAGITSVAILGVQKLAQSFNNAAQGAAAIGRAAQMSGIDPAQYQAIGNAVNLSGGDTAAAQATASSLAIQQQGLRFGQRSPAMSALAQYGINIAEPIARMYVDISRVLQQYSPAQRTLIAESRFGLDPGTAYFVSQGPQTVQAQLRQGASLGISSGEIKSLSDLAAGFRTLFQELTKTNLDELAAVSPVLRGLLSQAAAFVKYFDQTAVPELRADVVSVEKSVTSFTGWLNNLSKNVDQAGHNFGNAVRKFLGLPPLPDKPQPTPSLNSINNAVGNAGREVGNYLGTTSVAPTVERWWREIFGGGGGSGASVTPAQTTAAQNDVAAQMRAEFAKLGYSPTWSAGFTGNAFAESGLDPASKVFDTDNQYHYGLFMMSEAIRDKILAGMPNPVDVANASPADQVRALDWLLKNDPSYAKLVQAIANSPTASASAAANAVLGRFEKPADPNAGRVLRESAAERFSHMDPSKAAADLIRQHTAMLSSAALIAHHFTVNNHTDRSHHEHNVTVNVPSGDPHVIAAVVGKKLRQQQSLSVNLSGGNQR